MSCGNALQKIFDDAETPNNFAALSDIASINTAYYIRMSPVEAIMSAENSILKLWGGCLIRNNNTVTINASGVDRGYEVRLGKNLVGIEDDSDESGVVTRLYPTVVLGDADTVFALPEKYVDSPLSYGDPIIREVRIELAEEQQAYELTDIYDIMRDYCHNLFSVGNVDKPVINYRVNFVELSKTEEYKHLAILEQLDLYDIVTVNVAELGIDLKASVVKYKYDCIEERYRSIELGDFRYSSRYSQADIAISLQDKINKTESMVERNANLITRQPRRLCGHQTIPRRQAVRNFNHGHGRHQHGGQCHPVEPTGIRVFPDKWLQRAI